MPYPKEKMRLYMRGYRKRQKDKMDAIVRDWTNGVDLQRENENLKIERDYWKNRTLQKFLLPEGEMWFSTPLMLPQENPAFKYDLAITQ